MDSDLNLLDKLLYGWTVVQLDKAEQAGAGL